MKVAYKSGLFYFAANGLALLVFGFPKNSPVQYLNTFETASSLQKTNPAIRKLCSGQKFCLKTKNKVSLLHLKLKNINPFLKDMHMPDVFSSPAANEASSNYRESKRVEATGMGWLLPLLLLVFSAALILYFVKGSDTALPIAEQFITAIDSSANKISNQKVDSSNSYSMEIALPDNSFITGAKNGIEHHLVEYMKNVKDTVNKNRWFNFDNLSFENGSTSLTSSSIPQIKNIVTILKAYPKMKIKIGAFTEKTNDEAADLKLTEQQASSVATELKKAGADTTQITGAEGYGSTYAKAETNAPINEKMKDRKISINVTEK